MNFADAIKAHGDWKQKLINYLKHPDGSIKAADVQTDCKCALGQWIYGEGTKWGTHPEFSELKTEHALFHKAAAAIVVRADAGEAIDETKALGHTSEFGKRSTTVVRTIMAIQRRVLS